MRRFCRFPFHHYRRRHPGTNGALWGLNLFKRPQRRFINAVVQESQRNAEAFVAKWLAAVSVLLIHLFYRGTARQNEIPSERKHFSI